MEPSVLQSRHSPPGTAPGTLDVDPAAAPPVIHLITYGPDIGPDGMRRERLESIDDLPELPAGHTVCWLDIAGLGDRETIRKVGERFGLHPLALEDTVNVHQRPKVEAYDEHLFVVTRMPANPTGGGHADTDPADRPADAGWACRAGRLETEQFAAFVGNGFVVTFQEVAGDVFDAVRGRIRRANGRIRSRGADYLAYALLDAAVDSFFPLLERYGERVDELEQAVLDQPRDRHISAIHELKRDLLTVRRTIWPQREMLNALVREESPFIADETRLFLRDCYDHTIQLMDVTETYREICSSLVEIQLASNSNRMNDIMKVLTMIATIFIPLTFIAGVYGMNFDPQAGPWNMPELQWRYGYPAVLLAMGGLAVAMLVLFRRRGWLGA